MADKGVLDLGNEYSSGHVSLRDLALMVWEKVLADYEILKTKDLHGNSMADLITLISNGNLAVIGVIAISVVVSIFMLYMLTSTSPAASPKSTEPEEEPEPQRDFTLDQLREFNGETKKKIYIALRGDVYDVTSSSDFYGPGAPYNCFAGRNATRAMAKLSFEEEDLANPNVSDLGPFERDTLDGWVQKFMHIKGYPIVGKLSYPPVDRTITREELHSCNGTQTPKSDRIDAEIFVSLGGTVYDVSYGGKEMYGVDGPYHALAGKDATKALATMSLKVEDIDVMNYELTEAQKKTLSDWEAKFKNVKKYPIIGKLIA